MKEAIEKVIADLENNINPVWDEFDNGWNSATENAIRKLKELIANA